MGLLNVLGTIAGFLPIPGAQAIGKGLQAAGSVGSVLGTQQAAAGNAKVTQAELQQRQDQNALANYIAQQNTQNAAANTDLQRKSFEQQNRSATAKQALIGALLGGGITPTSIGQGGNISGGLLRSLNGNPDALAAMKLLGQQGALAQATPLAFQGGQIMEAPKLSTLPQTDNGGFLSTLARIGQLAGAVSPYIKPGQATAPEGPGAAAGLVGGMPGQDVDIPMRELPQSVYDPLAVRRNEIFRNVRL